MARVLASPGKYIQGAGEMRRPGMYAEGHGAEVPIPISEGGYRRTGGDIENNFAGVGCTSIFDYFYGECSEYKIERLRGVMKKGTCNFVIGIGGEKILDTVKAVVHCEKTVVLICPTIASTDAPCGVLSVIYIDEGVFEGHLFLPASPNLVLMDTDITVKPPVRLTVTGMGDVLTTCFEAQACKQSNTVSCAGSKVTEAAMIPAKLCSETLMEEGAKAKPALETGVYTSAAEKIIEVNTLLGGIGFENAGPARAHTIHSSLTVLEECHHMYHGERVAFGTITQLILENARAAKLRKIIEFCIELGLPVTLEELDAAETTKEKIMTVAEAACAENDTLHNMPFEAAPDKVYAAIIAADAYGHYFLSKS